MADMDRSGWQRTIKNELNEIQKRSDEVRRLVGDDIRFTYDTQELWEIHVRRAISDVENAAHTLQSLSFLSLRDATVPDPERAKA